MIWGGGKQSSNTDYNKVRIAVISWTSALSEYKHEAQPKPSRYLAIVLCVTISRTSLKVFFRELKVKFRNKGAGK